MLMPAAPLGFQGLSEIASSGLSSRKGPFQMLTGLFLFTALDLCNTSFTNVVLYLQGLCGIICKLNEANFEDTAQV